LIGAKNPLLLLGIRRHLPGGLVGHHLLLILYHLRVERGILAHWEALIPLIVHLRLVHRVHARVRLLVHHAVALLVLHHSIVISRDIVHVVHHIRVLHAHWVLLPVRVVHWMRPTRVTAHVHRVHWPVVHGLGHAGPHLMNIKIVAICILRELTVHAGIGAYVLPYLMTRVHIGYLVHWVGLVRVVWEVGSIAPALGHARVHCRHPHALLHCWIVHWIAHCVWMDATGSRLVRIELILSWVHLGRPGEAVHLTPAELIVLLIHLTIAQILISCLFTVWRFLVF